MNNTLKASVNGRHALFLDEGSRLETLCLDSMSVYIFSPAVDLFLSRTSFTHKVQEGTRSACDDLERKLPLQNKLSEQPCILMAFPDRKTFSDGHHLKDDIIYTITIFISYKVFVCQLWLQISIVLYIHIDYNLFWKTTNTWILPGMNWNKFVPVNK